MTSDFLLGTAVPRNYLLQPGVLLLLLWLEFFFSQSTLVYPNALHPSLTQSIFEGIS